MRAATAGGRPLPIRPHILVDPKRVLSRLPGQPTTLIGRDAELRLASERLADPDVRLLTLTGPGGSGKTVLSIALARAMSDQFDERVCFVDLSGVSDPALVPAQISTALGIAETDHRPPVDAICAAVGSRQLLLVLDNFEQVLAARTEVVALLESCPGLVALVTSRAPLKLRWEHELPVPPLTLPDLKRSWTATDLVNVPALALFINRAQAVQPGLPLDDASIRAIATICVRLDGLPLAIELAAAWVKVLNIPALLARLERRFELLRGGPLDAPARHRTLRAAIAWSYDLLEPSEQVALRRVAVFVDGFSLEAAEAVVFDVDEAGAADGTDPLDLVRALVDKSLVRPQSGPPHGQLRFHQMETIREYGLDQLTTQAELAEVRGRHALFFCALAEQSAVEVRGADQADWLHRLELEHGNLRAALEWSLGGGDSELAARMAAALRQFWSVRGHLREASGWLARAIELPGLTPQRRASVLVAAGQIAREQTEYARARSLLESGLALYRALDDRPGVAAGLGHLGELFRYAGEYAQATQCIEEAWRIHTEMGNEVGISVCLSRLGVMARADGDYVKAADLYTQSLAIDRQLGNRRGMAITLNNLGVLAGTRGDHAEAGRLFEDSLAIRRELGDKRGTALELKNLGDVARYLNDFERAAALYRESAEVRHEIGDPWGLLLCIDGLAAVAALRGSFERAARLSGACAAQRQALGAPLTPDEQKDFEETRLAAAKALGSAAFEVEWQAGQAFGLDEALLLALEPYADATAPAAASTSEASQSSRALPGQLSRREREVAALVATGLTNREIAERLVLSERTIDAHVEHIRNKLGVRSRALIATWAEAHGLTAPQQPGS